MAIPASNIVTVTPRVISAGGKSLEISGLFITKNPLCPFPGAKEFTGANDVANFFGSDSDEYRAAAKYFLGYDNSFKKPRAVYFSRYSGEALAGELIGGTAGTLKEIQAVTDGTFIITVDGTEVTVDNLDFSAIKTQSEAATIIQGKLTGTTVAYNAGIGAFVITSATTGENSNVSFADGNAAEVLGIAESSGAQISAGAEAQNQAGQMKSITDYANNWVSFTTLFKPSVEEIEGYASWTNDQNVDYLYVIWTEDKADTLSANASNLPNTLKKLNPEGVTMVYAATGKGIEKAAFIMGIGGSIDWNRTNGLPTFMFLSQTGQTADVTNGAVSSELIGMNVNYYGEYATRADSFILLAEGKMLAGNYDYIDTYLAMVWLKNAIQLACMSGLKQSLVTPYNDAGYTKVRAWISDPIAQAKVNGVIRAGVTLNESQKAQLTSEIGSDQSNTIYTDGYYLVVSDPGALVRQQRGTPVIGLWFTYGGSIHKLDIPATLIK